MDERIKKLYLADRRRCKENLKLLKQWYSERIFEYMEILRDEKYQTELMKVLTELNREWKIK